MIDETKDEEEEREEYWSGITIPINPSYLADNTAPANPVTVVDKFLEAVAIATHLGSEAETLSKQINVLELEKAEQLRQIGLIRRDIIRKNFKDLKASFNGEQMDAFVLAHAEPHQATLMAFHEAEIGCLSADLDALMPRLKVLDRRFKMHVLVMDWARQYVDYDKYQGKINQGKR